MTPRELTIKYGITPNKALGQNFLADENAVRRIVSAAAEPGLPVLEIGPGLGALTAPLVETGLPIAAVELDSAMCAVLKAELGDGLYIVNEDFLKCDLNAVHAVLGGGEVSIVGNLPYYITGAIVQRLVLSGLPIRSMTLMMQKEASERFTAKPGDKNYVPLTVLAQRLYTVRPMMDLSPASYWPQPDVASTVLLFERNGNSLPAMLPRIVKAAFAMRRKTLQNNLSALGLTKAQASELIVFCGLDPKARAETLSCSEFVSLAEAFESMR
ncbi:MAG: ribosomal RNA small subunit methyltransferase A [Clostridia bacterium]|nr:ribosomal RNA small subunit methyltransferase A [Clostridia bacterium]